MPSQLPPTPPRPITARAAENGLWLSLYISVLVLSMGFSTKYMLATLVLWAGTIGMPFYVYRFLRRSSQATDGALSFPELWAEGIASFFLGTLIPAVLVYVLLRFVSPMFIPDTLSDAVEILRSQGTPASDGMASQLEYIIAKRDFPSAVDISAQLISFNIIAGTTLSLIMSMIVKSRSIRERRRSHTGK